MGKPSHAADHRSGSGGLNELDDLIAAGLIGRYQRGDLEAFVLLHNRYRQRVFNFACVRLGCEDDADDVTQQVFFKVFQALPAYKPTGRSFRRWLLTVTKNTAEDDWRRTRHSEPRAPADLDRRLDAVQEFAPGWGDDALLHELLSELSEPERQVLVLLYRWDLSPRETALALDRSETAVYKSHARSLAKLRERLGRA